MRITNYEHTGLDLVNQWLVKNGEQNINKETLCELLKTANVTFVLEGINRLQSMLICELKDSYVQQSQRYVTMAEDGYILPEMDEQDTQKAKNLIQASLDLYQKMSEMKGDFKGRPKPDQYVYGIPIEDARYILPVTIKTNITVAMSGDKLWDMFRLFNHPSYEMIFKEIKINLLSVLPEHIGKVLEAQNWCYADETVVIDHYAEQLKELNADQPVKLLGHFGDLDLHVGLGALTSTMSKTPSQVLEGWADEAEEKAQAVTKRVLSYGHSSIAEQARVTFGLMFSLVTYHQQVRHRLTSNYREPLNQVIENDRPVVVPPAIESSAFAQEYHQLVAEFKQFRRDLKEKYDQGQQWYFLLNCDQVKVIMSSNARMDCQMLQERICYNAQWEIRRVSVAKLEALQKLSSVLYRNALPSCAYGACKEGKYTCGKAAEIRRQFVNSI